MIIAAVALGPILSAGAADLSPEQIKAAHKIYILKCAKCHELYDPHKYTDANWATWMVKMKKKSKLKDDQFDLLERYTEKLRSDPPPAGKK